MYTGYSKFYGFQFNVLLILLVMVVSDLFNISAFFGIVQVCLSR